MKLYALHPGPAFSIHDDDLHYINGRGLADLYGLRPNEYVIWDDQKPQTYLGRKREDYTHLHVRESGNYSIKERLRKYNGENISSR